MMNASIVRRLKEAMSELDEATVGLAQFDNNVEKERKKLVLKVTMAQAKVSVLVGAVEERIER